RTQPLTNISGLALGACVSEGLRSAGTGRGWVEAASAAGICSRGVNGRGSGTGAEIAAGAAASPAPTGTGRIANSTNAAHTAVAVATAPTARLRTVEDRNASANRAGFSTRCSVMIANPSDTSTIARLPASPMSLPNRAGARISTGQCHRYHEYDTRPIDRITGVDRNRPAPRSGVAQPAMITSAVPNTGSSAAVPGYGVASSTCVQVSAMSASPPQPTTAADTAGSRRHHGIVNATRPPTASSQARLGSPKNAHDGDDSVSVSDTPNDTAPTAVSATRYGVADRIAATPASRVVRPSSHTVARISAGHTR